MDDRITFSLAADLKKAFQKILIDEDDDMSTVLRQAVKDYVIRHSRQRVYS